MASASDSVGKDKYGRDFRHHYLDYHGIIHEYTERWMVCGFCDAKGWVTDSNDSWNTSEFEFLRLDFCPTHKHLKEQMDKTLHVTFTNEACRIVRDVSLRLNNQHINAVLNTE